LLNKGIEITISMVNSNWKIDVLGLDRKCSNDEVLDAYIRLSKQYHPDVNKDNGAEEKYKSITM
jgi:molecular chaperone DnaJ